MLLSPSLLRTTVSAQPFVHPLLSPPLAAAARDVMDHHLWGYLPWAVPFQPCRPGLLSRRQGFCSPAWAPYRRHSCCCSSRAGPFHAVFWLGLPWRSMPGRQLNSFQCSVLESSQEVKEEPEQEEQLHSPGLEAAPAPSSSRERCWSNPEGALLPRALPQMDLGACFLNSLSLLSRDNPWLWAMGRRWPGHVGCSGSQQSGVCSVRSKAGLCLGAQQRGQLPSAWAGGEPKGLSNLLASVAQGRGLLPFELCLRVVAISHSPLYIEE